MHQLEAWNVEEIQPLLEMIRSVGAYQLERFEQAHVVETKSNIHDLVTDVDRESEAKIVRFLEERYPGHSILGEEGTQDDRKSDFLWVVDPLDGTVNYAHGFPIFAISVALQFKGKPVLGAIYAPKLNEMFWAIKGMGAFLNDRKIHVSPCERLEEALVGTGFAYVRDGRFDNLKYFNHFYRITRGIRRPGSAALDLACVAAGRLDGFWEFNLQPWDVAAGILLIEEAGGTIIDLSSLEAGSALIAGNEVMVKNIFRELKKAGYEA